MMCILGSPVMAWHLAQLMPCTRNAQTSTPSRELIAEGPPKASRNGKNARARATGTPSSATGSGSRCGPVSCQFGLH